MRQIALWFIVGFLSLWFPMPVTALTWNEADAAIEQAYLDRYGTPRQESQLTISSKSVWIANILNGSIPWAFNACGPVWSVEVLRCSLGLLPPTAPIQQSFGPPIAAPTPPAPVPIPASPQVPAWPDATLALAHATQLACAGPIRTIQYEAGVYHFLTPPDPFPCGVILIGQGKGATILERNYSGGDFLAWVGGQEGGGGLTQLAVYAGAGTSGGHGVLVQAQAAHAIGTIAGAVVLRDVTISGAGTWDWPLRLDGSGRTDCASACGVRIVRLDNVHLFQGMLGNLLCLNCISLEWIGGGSYGQNPGILFIGGTGNYLNADLQGMLSGPVRLGR